MSPEKRKKAHHERQRKHVENKHSPNYRLNLKEKLNTEETNVAIPSQAFLDEIVAHALLISIKKRTYKQSQESDAETERDYKFIDDYMGRDIQSERYTQTAISLFNKLNRNDQLKIYQVYQHRQPEQDNPRKLSA